MSSSQPSLNQSQEEHRLALLKRCGLFGDDTHGVLIRRAETRDELQQAYRLVHDSYVEAGYIKPHSSRMRARVFDASPNMATFIAKSGQRVVGALSIVADSPTLGLPADVVFRTELDDLRATGAALCEVTNQAVSSEFRKSAVTTELMRCAMAHALIQGYDEGIAVISPNHAEFYRLLQFRQIGPIRNYNYGGTESDLVRFLSVDLSFFLRPFQGSDVVRQFIWNFMSRQNRFLRQVRTWESAARRQFLKPDLLRQLFVTEAGLLERCTAAQIDSLRELWGPQLFEKVTDCVASSDLSEDPGDCPLAQAPAIAYSAYGRRRR